jgi:hypothetical protein
MKFQAKIKNCFWPNKTNNFQPYILNDKVITAFILLFLLSKVLFSFQLLLIQQSALFADLNAQQIVTLTNQVREQYGLAPLKENPLLDEAAQAKAADMFKNNYFAHFSPTGISPWFWIDSSGYDYHYAGENLAMNFIDSQEVVKAWLNSPSHRENLLNSHYQDIGIAVLPADPSKPGLNEPIVVQMFGSPQIARAQTVAVNTPTTSPTTKPSTLPSSQEVLGEESKVTPTTISQLTTTTTQLQETTTTSAPPVVAEVNTTVPPAQILSTLQTDTRTKINVINRIIALSLIFLGAIVILGILVNQKAIPFSFSEVVLRSAIVIIIGASFFAFHLERFIGQLVIS